MLQALLPHLPGKRAIYGSLSDPLRFTGKVHRIAWYPARGSKNIKRTLTSVVKPLLSNLARHDIAMIEEEQQSFEENPDRHSFEVNSALHCVQQLICDQATVA